MICRITSCERGLHNDFYYWLERNLILVLLQTQNRITHPIIFINFLFPDFIRHSRFDSILNNELFSLKYDGGRLSLTTKHHLPQIAIKIWSLNNEYKIWTISKLVSNEIYWLDQFGC